MVNRGWLPQSELKARSPLPNATESVNLEAIVRKTEQVMRARSLKTRTTRHRV